VPITRERPADRLPILGADVKTEPSTAGSAAPRISYPAELPITARVDEIRAAIRDNQVVVVAGETGSGKTTQLPKVCLDLGRGTDGRRIGHTQPRRVAARTVAERIAEEVGTPLGETVGYQVRFTDRVSAATQVKVMTDGILLAEIQRDRTLRRYDTLIVDEAHERSLNIDFILGYLTQLLPRRPDLKLVITSATIDPERFSRHFGGAPIVEVSGRTYPVEVRYRPVVDPDDPATADRDQVQAISEAIDELATEGPGDVLVFLSGEREIRDTADALRRRQLRNTEVLPMYARLSAADQHRVFQPHTGRRIVLATNIAETSLTVPGIKYVVDPGTARISRYSHRTKVQRLPIEAISQASARQRAGRCGRTSDGICIRLYTEDDFDSRPEFTEPEILRTNLASVILQMTALGLGDVARFPFVEPPDRRRVTDGVHLLEELGALDPKATHPRDRLTRLGRDLVQLPVDPRLARMVLAADEQGCVQEVLVIAAALSIQDPRERPAEHTEAADASHRRFAEPGSDFLAYLNLWNYVHEQQKALSGSQFRKLCTREYLHYLRIREWQDLYGQLRTVAKTLGVTLSRSAAHPDHVHRALLAGLLSHVGLRDREARDYGGARGARFGIFPGSGLFGKPPEWVMAAELVETSRLWARTVARIEPAWAEELAGHLVKRSYSEPHWSADRGAAMAYEKVTLYGLPLVAGRRVNYGRIDPALSRELFIRHALVEGEWRTHHRFFRENRALLAEAEELEHRVRRRDIVVDDDELFAFYDARVPATVVSARHFDRWWKKTRQRQPDLLSFRPEMLVTERAAGVRAEDYPDTWEVDGLTLGLSYQFAPGADADGVTVRVPLAVLNQLTPEAFEWQVPGLRAELVTALIRSLPKAVRRLFVPVPDTAERVLAVLAPGLRPGSESLLEGLSRELGRIGRVSLRYDDWHCERVPDHLRVTFRVVDDDGKALAEGKDLLALRRKLVPEVREVIASAVAEVRPEIERDGLRSWTVDVLPRTLSHVRGGHAVVGYPALVDDGDSVAVRVLESEAAQRQAHRAGVRRLLLLATGSPVKTVLGRLDNRTKLALGSAPHARAAELFDDCLACAVDALVDEAGGPAWDADGFARLAEHVSANLVAEVVLVIKRVSSVLAAAASIRSTLDSLGGPAASVDDIRAQLAGLVYPGFVTATGTVRLRDLPRYLTAIERRLDKLPADPVRDRTKTADVAHVQRTYEEFLGELPPARRADDAVADIRWMIEELRVSLFAQTLGTAYPVSEKRIFRAMDDAADRAADPG
jgi:ATP-dependent helicase HrpA